MKAIRRFGLFVRESEPHVWAVATNGHLHFFVCSDSVFGVDDEWFEEVSDVVVDQLWHAYAEVTALVRPRADMQLMRGLQVVLAPVAVSVSRRLWQLILFLVECYERKNTW